MAHTRLIGRTEGIDKTIDDNEIDVIIAPADSPLSDIASAAGKFPIPETRLWRER